MYANDKLSCQAHVRDMQDVSQTKNQPAVLCLFRFPSSSSPALNFIGGLDAKCLPSSFFFFWLIWSLSGNRGKYLPEFVSHLWKYSNPKITAYYASLTKCSKGWRVCSLLINQKLNINNQQMINEFVVDFVTWYSNNGKDVVNAKTRLPHKST